MSRLEALDIQAG